MAGGPFNPGNIFGTDDTEDAQKYAKNSTRQWGLLRDRYEGGSLMGDPVNLKPGELSVGEGDGQLHEYDAGPSQNAFQADWLDPTQAGRAGLQAESQFKKMGPSAWEGGTSAFDARGPSAYESRGPSAFDDYGSAFENVGPSAYGDLRYDAGALEGLDASGGYYRDLMGSGSDPIAEADFQRRTAAAEGSRRANTDAALQQLEQRGQGNANAGLLSELSNQQASVSDQYLAGLDANAMAAARRDAAARSGADVAAMRGQGMLAADTARAGGMDEYERARAQGLDVAGATRAAGQDTYSGQNAAGLDTYSGQNAAGRDTYAGNQNAGLDTYGQGKAAGMDDFANQRYAEYYGTQEGNVDRLQAADDRNMDRTWGAQDANTDMLNNANYYNTVTRPQQLFGQEMTLTGGRAGAEAGTANTYSQNAPTDQAANQYGFQVFGKAAEAAGKKAGV